MKYPLGPDEIRSHTPCEKYSFIEFSYASSYLKCVSLDIHGCFTDTSVTVHDNFMFCRDFQSVFMAIKFTSVISSISA